MGDVRSDEAEGPWNVKHSLIQSETSEKASTTMSLIAYATVGSDKMNRAIPFFSQILAPLGATKLFDHPSGGALFGKDGMISFGVLVPYDRKPATAGNGAMIAFNLPSREAVDAMHAKALALGGSDEGGAGERAPGFYAAYFRDLDGNKFCACKLG